MFRKKTTTDIEKPTEKTAHIIDCGMLSDLVWPGPVSAKELVAKGEVDPVRVQQAIAKVNNFYVSVASGAKTRCIDGRPDPDFDADNLGAQVPGGAPGAALAWRLGVDKDDLTRGTFLDDATHMIGTFLRVGFAPGGHRDDESHGAKAGCGAIDGMDAILAAMTNPKLVDDHKRMVKQLLGSEFDRDTYLRVMGAAVVVNGRSRDYFRHREAVLDVLEKRAPHSVATLTGAHKECITIVNLVPGTTFASRTFSDVFDGMQVFGYDLWRSKQMAAKLLPRPDQEVDRRRFVMARVMYTVATLMALTDGSQRLLIRVPAEA